MLEHTPSSSDPKTPLNAAVQLAITGNAEASEAILRELRPRDPKVAFNLGWHELRLGNWEQGIAQLDAGRHGNVFGNALLRGKTPGEHTNLQNKVTLLRMEGGFGDQICALRFARYLQDVRGAKVVVSCDDALGPLFKASGLTCVTHAAADLVFYDYWIPAMSAPRILKLSRDELPKDPWILAKKAYQFDTDKLKVGVRWSGNPEFEHEQHRRFPTDLMISLHDIPGVEFYSLQRDDNLIDDLPFTDLRDELETWEDTRDVVAGLDLIITSDTSVAHLAAAMGKPVWNVLPVLPYYLYALPGDTTPWYPSMRLYRQTEYGKWEAPFETIRQDLTELASQQSK